LARGTGGAHVGARKDGTMIFFIIWGTKGITTSKGSGRFGCPACGGERGYIHKQVRRFFTLYFIPLIPLQIVGTYVECQGCGGTFNDTVLDRPRLGA
jgi:hypothetical protein